MKTCARCREAKPLEQFSHASKGRDRRQSWCKECVCEYMRGRYKRDPLKARESDLRIQFGMSLETYEAMLEAQGGVCAICKGGEPRAGHSLAVDHDAATGLVRGLLCSRCNLALGHMHDQPDRLRRAAQYLEDHAAVTAPSL